MSLTALPAAWVVKCKGCGCVITCKAVDPQREHTERQNPEPPPAYAVCVACSCCWKAYRYDPSEIYMKAPMPNDACLRLGKPSNRPPASSKSDSKNVLLVAASLIAAVRLNREPIENSPIVEAKIGDSLRLARMILKRLESR